VVKTGVTILMGTYGTCLCTYLWFTVHTLMLKCYLLEQVSSFIFPFFLSVFSITWHAHWRCDLIWHYVSFCFTCRRDTYQPTGHRIHTTVTNHTRNAVYSNLKINW
jgi:hypothetical protein